MPDMAYGDFSLKPYVFCVEDVAYDWSPSSFKRLHADDGIRTSSTLMLDLSRQIVTPTVLGSEDWYTGGALNVQPNAKYLATQRWMADWQDAFMDVCMYDHLCTLHSLSKHFWIAFDDEMSRDCALLEPVDAARTIFTTPTYPIAYYRVADVNGIAQFEHQYAQVFVDGSPLDWDTNPWRIDAELGVVVFTNSVDAEAVVTLKYLWRACVRIAEIELVPVVEIAQHVYQGSVTFEQVVAPYRVDRFDDVWSRSPCRRCGDDRYLDGGDDATCTDYTAPALVTSASKPLSAIDWNYPENADASDDLYATASGFGGSSALNWYDVDDILNVVSFYSLERELFNGFPYRAFGGVTALGSSTTDWLHAQQFNLDLPNDGLARSVSQIDILVEGNASLSASAFITEVFLTYKGIAVGPNLVTGAPLELSQTDGEFTFTDLNVAGIPYEGFQKAEVGVQISVTVTSVDAVTINIDRVALGICWVDGADVLPVPTVCGCDKDGPTDGTYTLIERTCQTHQWEEALTGWNIPEDHYVHGVEIVNLTAGANNGCPADALALIRSKLKLNAPGSTYGSVQYQKSFQPVPIVDHAYLNVIDGTSDYSKGGPNDLWGRPFNAWTAPMINTYGLKFEEYWETECLAANEDSWDITYEYNGQYEYSNYCNAPLTTEWPDTPSPGWRDYAMYTCGEGYIESQSQGEVVINFVFTGTGPPPDWVDIDVYSAAYVHGYGAPFNAYAVSNGQGDPIEAIPIGDSRYYFFGKRAVGTHTYRVPLTAGVGSLVFDLDAHGWKPSTTTGAQDVYAGVYIEASVPACTLPERTAFQAVVHHSRACNTGALNFQSATVDGTWNRDHLRGIAGGLAQSSDGAVTGAFSLLGTDFPVESFGANSRMVGFKVTGEYRLVGTAARADQMTLTVHAGSYDGARVGKSLPYPVSDEWAAFSVGQEGDYWDYSAIFTETGVTYPTATGSQVNSYLALELLGSNIAGAAYEFRNVALTIYFADVCDGL